MFGGGLPSAVAWLGATIGCFGEGHLVADTSAFGGQANVIFGRRMWTRRLFPTCLFSFASVILAIMLGVVGLVRLVCRRTVLLRSPGARRAWGRLYGTCMVYSPQGSVGVRFLKHGGGCSASFPTATTRWPVRVGYDVVVYKALRRGLGAHLQS